MKFAFKVPQMNRSWLTLGGALMLGLVALVGTQKFLRDQEAALQHRHDGQYRMVDVVVAKRDLARGETVSGETFATLPMPAEFLNSASIRPEQFGAYAGQRLAGPIHSGEPLLSFYVESPSSGFSYAVTDGNRGLTTEVDEVNSISGMLRPTDHIDLLATAHGSAPGAAETTFPLLANVEVLATGQATHKGEGNEQGRTYTTITLSVSPEDAQRIIVAKSSGKLTAVLRNPGDAKAGATAAMNIDDVVPKKHPDVKHLAVQYIVGGRS